MKVPIVLPQILGVDRKNPWITVFRDASSSPAELHVFWGSSLLETVPDDKEKPEFKLLVARLYNAGLKVSALIEAFQVPRTSMKRWGDALKSNDPETLVRVLSGRRHPRKLTVEILSYAQMRFECIYPRNRHSYSQKIRDEITKVFGVTISSESLRPHFKEWKSELSCSTRCNVAKDRGGEREGKAEDGDGDDSEEGGVTARIGSPSGSPANGKPVGASERPPAAPSQESLKSQDVAIPIRKGSLSFYVSPGEFFCHHAGVLLFSAFLVMASRVGDMVKQLAATILLGAVNIEQTKTLDFDALGSFLGKVSVRPGAQRSLLAEMARERKGDEILELNASLVGIHSHDTFYYDPHTKHYTGMKKILKGWCAGIRFADKIMNMDFIHTTSGQPVYLSHDDNFHDLRERFPAVADTFRKALNIPGKKKLTFVLDRGIYGLDAFQKITGEGTSLHIITWEKGYCKGEWEEGGTTGSCHLFRCRNSSRDLLPYRFEFIDRIWEKDASFRQIIVRATNHRGKTIEVSILCSDLDRSAEEVVTLMFRRWVQENDFKYLNGHFGIDEITSYGATPYGELEDGVKDRQVKSGKLKALEPERAELKKKLANCLLNEHRSEKKDRKRVEKIEALTLELKKVEEKVDNTEKKESRLQQTINGEYVKLESSQKEVMDSIKILARNIFYLSLEPFKKLYDNYRDDHVLFRNLTRAHGCVRMEKEEVLVTLFPTAHLQPKLRKIMQTVMDDINGQKTTVPDGSGRTLSFTLGKREKRIFTIKMDN